MVFKALSNILFRAKNAHFGKEKLNVIENQSHKANHDRKFNLPLKKDYIRANLILKFVTIG